MWKLNGLRTLNKSRLGSPNRLVVFSEWKAETTCHYRLYMINYQENFPGNKRRKQECERLELLDWDMLATCLPTS